MISYLVFLLPAGLVEEIVVSEIRRVIRAPEITARTVRAVQEARPDLKEAAIITAMQGFDQLWAALLSAEQMRIIHLLVDRVTVGEAPLVIGRLPDCDVTLNDPNVSRRHAEVVLDGESAVLTDLGSTNGTRVNGAPARTVRLQHGDEIFIGSSRLVFEAP